MNKSQSVHSGNTYFTGVDDMQLKIPADVIRKINYSLSSRCCGIPMERQTTILIDLGRIPSENWVQAESIGFSIKGKIMCTSLGWKVRVTPYEDFVLEIFE